MYGKIFEQMYDSTVAECWEALVTMQQMIVLADDKGIVDMTPESIARRTNIPLKIIEKGIAKLLQPDPKSRSEDCNGRRIVPIEEHRDWGWMIVNYEKYRDLASRSDRAKQSTERSKRWRDRQKNTNKINDETRGDAAGRLGRHTDTDTDVKNICRLFEDWWQHVPRKEGKGDARKAYKAALKVADHDTLVAGIKRYAAEVKDSEKQYIKMPAGWLRAERWADEGKKPRKEPTGPNVL